MYNKHILHFKITITIKWMFHFHFTLFTTKSFNCVSFHFIFSLVLSRLILFMPRHCTIVHIWNFVIVYRKRVCHIIYFCACMCLLVSMACLPALMRLIGQWYLRIALIETHIIISTLKICVLRTYSTRTHIHTQFGDCWRGSQLRATSSLSYSMMLCNVI